MTKTQRPQSAQKMSWQDFVVVRAVFQALNQDGFEARVVGGAVRNSLIGHTLSDIDMATTAKPEDVIALAKKAGLKTIPTGLAHGTVTVMLSQNPPVGEPNSVEVTTLRHDVKTNGRHATVAFTRNWHDDAARRDFTINALYADADGKISDPMNGLADLETRHIRFIGDPDARIAEDYLRILRFFRFAAQFTPAGASLDQAGLAAVARGAAGRSKDGDTGTAGFSALSAERVRSELFRLLLAPEALRSLRAMRNTGILHLVLGVPYLGVFNNLLQAEATLSIKGDVLRRLAALAAQTKEDTVRLSLRLKLSNAERQHLLGMMRRTPHIHQDMRESAAKVALYRLGPDLFRDKVLLGWARGEQGYQPGRWIWLYELPDRWTAPAFPIKGADIAALGLPEGPHIGQLLREAETYWITHNFEPSARNLHRTVKQRVKALLKAPGLSD